VRQLVQQREVVGGTVEHRLGLRLQGVAELRGVVDDRADRLERVGPVQVLQELTTSGTLRGACADFQACVGSTAT
jgi:hypothetical protein